jgi:ATPase
MAKKNSLKENSSLSKNIVKKIVPDTSVIVEGILSKKIEKKDISPEKIIIHESVMAELESQANKNRETGFLGLEEVKKLRELSVKYKFEVLFKGSRPTDFEIKHAKSGEIDSVIRKLAFDEEATLVTADKVQSLVAESKGISVLLFEFELEKTPFVLEKYFDEKTMSVHIRENCKIMAKKGKPGNFEYQKISDEVLDREAVKELAKNIIEEASGRTDGFIEADRKGSTILQIANYRIVITRPPFADGYEITAVRPIVKLSLDDYYLGESILSRIDKAAEGILIAGPPGHGKTTFAQGIAEHYLAKKKVIKTIESPRDLSLGDEITQYSMTHGGSQEIHDILLLSRPDYTIFDEMRNTEDFRLFSDLRLSGVGMVGVIHATKPVDAIQRFIGRIELGVIPHIIDTVIFIESGKIKTILSLGMQVKVPSGMIEADLARPIVTVHDFITGRLEFEIYSYGEETVVVPVVAEQRPAIHRLAEESIKKEILLHVSKARVEMVSSERCKVFVPVGEKFKLIGSEGKKISDIEKKLGVLIDILEEEEKKSVKRDDRKENLPYQIKVEANNILFALRPENSDKEIDIYANGDFILSAKSSKKGIISISKKSNMGVAILKSIQSGEKIEIKG